MSARDNRRRKSRARRRLKVWWRARRRALFILGVFRTIADTDRLFELLPMKLSDPDDPQFRYERETVFASPVRAAFETSSGDTVTEFELESSRPPGLTLMGWAEKMAGVKSKPQKDQT